MKTVHLFTLFSAFTTFYLSASDKETRMIVPDGHHYHLAIQDEKTNNETHLAAGELPVVLQTEKVAATYVRTCLEEARTSISTTRYIEALFCLYEAGALPFGELMHFLRHPDFQEEYTTHHFILIDETANKQAVIEGTMPLESVKEEVTAVLSVVKEHLGSTPSAAEKQFIVGVHNLFLSKHITAQHCIGMLTCDETICCARSGSTGNGDLIGPAPAVLV